jgi:hypothetical protein
MATTTPNYGWTVPTSTDLVKDGATAIETLGDAIDASMNTALGTKKAGMVLLSSLSFSGVATQDVLDVFSSTYENYRIVIRAHGSTNANLRMQYVLATTPTTANYARILMGIDISNNSLNNVNGSDSSIILSELGNGATQTAAASLDIYSPNLATQTWVAGISYGSNSLTTQAFQYVARNSATSQYTGVRLLPSSGNITGTISVYGYNK